MQVQVTRLSDRHPDNTTSTNTQSTEWQDGKIKDMAPSTYSLQVRKFEFELTGKCFIDKQFVSGVIFQFKHFKIH